MLNFLVAVEHSLEASFALRTACLLGEDIHIQPIYVFDPPGRDMTFGAGWARKSWEREVRQQAMSVIDDLLQAERSQCANIEEPMVLMGDSVHEMAGYFWKGGFDLLVVGAPYRERGLLALSLRLWQAAKKAHRELPLMVVRHLKSINRVVGLTDGSGPAERALGLLVRLSPLLSPMITLVGLPKASGSAAETEALNLERGLAILKEKGIDAVGRKASEMSADGLPALLKASDMVVSAYLKDEYHTHLHGVSEHDLPAALFFIGRD